MKARTGVMLIVLCLCGGRNIGTAQVNYWTNNASGYWQDPYWSLGTLPGTNQSVMFVNQGWKALAIGQSTTANFSNSLVIQTLSIDAPTSSFNQLLLNYAGTNVPLRVSNYFTLGTNASLVSYHSALVVSGLELYSPALFAESSRLSADTINNYSTLSLSNSLSSSRVVVAHQNSAVRQSGGNSQFDTIAMEANSRFTAWNGALEVNSLLVQSPFFDELTNGTATFLLDGGNMVVNSLTLGEPTYSAIEGNFLLRGGDLVCSNYSIWNGSFEQSGATNVIATLALPAGIYADANFYADATYKLSAGTLLTGNVYLGEYVQPDDHIFVVYPGHFLQSGGVHTNDTLILQGSLFAPPPGYNPTPESAGFVSLSGGLLVSTNEVVGGGEFTQTGGTNRAESLSISFGGSYSLAAGTLFTHQTLIWGYAKNWSPYSPSCSPATAFVQQSGAHVANSLVIEGLACYELDAGMVMAQDIFIDSTSQLTCTNGSVTNWGTFTLQGGSFVPGNQSHFLGQLQLLAVTNLLGLCVNTGAVSLDLTGPPETVVRFRDSSTADWSGPGLQLLGWQPWTGAVGSHHIFFGTNAHGLTAGQLNKMAFVNPYGRPAGIYPARILETGEVIPVEAFPPITVTRTSGGFILSWPGTNELLSATNILGPYTVVEGAVSPTTNVFTTPQEFFRLSSPSP